MRRRTPDRRRSDDSDTDAPEQERVPAPTSADAWLSLQRGIGNRAIQRLLPAGNTQPSPPSTNEHAGSRPLDHDVRQEMEAHFDADLSHVRVHDGVEAVDRARAQEAAAFTSGDDVYFGAGRFAPHTAAGRHLLAHELAHVLQQTRPRDGRTTHADAETEADRAADHIAAGLPLPALEAAPAEVPARQPSTWAADVQDAKKKNDAAALAGLLRSALAGLKRTVVVAKTQPGGSIAPSDYQPLPQLNFEINLNSKQSKQLTAGGGTHSLANNYGYAFSDGATKYVVLGPRAIDESSPLFSMMYAEHELFHSVHHLGGATAGGGKTQVRPTDAEEELQAYTEDFINYFHQLRSFMPQWGPLIEFYERSGTTERARTLARLKSYYSTPPSPPIGTADVEAVKRAFAKWLRRRLRDATSSSKQLIQDLSRELSITLSAPSRPPASSSGGSGDTD
jgi:hypothetical protein